MANVGSLSGLQKREAEEAQRRMQEMTEGSGEWDTADQEKWKRMQAAAQSTGPLPNNHRIVTVYRNGFTINEGPLRPLADPLNKKFMDEMANGIAPAELQEGIDEPVHVAVYDKRAEDYEEPNPPPYVKFSGEGNSLAASSTACAPVQADAGTIDLDPSKPTTQLQIRFHDGQKVAQNFHEVHTVGDLRNFCRQCVKGESVILMHGFPLQPLTDDSMTLQDAALCGSAVTVKLA